VRPVRETMGAIGGIKQLQGLMLVTFIVMMIAVPAYSALVAKLPRRWVVRLIYHFFSLSLLTFSLTLQSEWDALRIWSARVFFVWVNVFALFATSVFWSVLADLFTSNQGKRLFGAIAAGGTFGAISGSLLTSQIATSFSTASLLLLPIATLQAGLWCAWRLEKQASRLTALSDSESDAPELQTATTGSTEEAGLTNHAHDTGDARTIKDAHGTKDVDKGSPTGGDWWAGVSRIFASPYLASICVYLFFAQTCGTQLYFQQAEIVRAAVPIDAEKTQLFAYVDFGTQTLTLLVQILLASTLLRRFGMAIALTTLPAAYVIAFGALSFHQALPLLITAVIVTRATAYGVIVPAREVLFTVVSREDKYKSKSFIDTVVLRGGDALAGQFFGMLKNSVGLGLSQLNFFALPVAAAWGWAGWRLGKRQAQLARQKE
ncbi:MAG: MFS transporter, partial [Planctomycetota bacterium]